MFGELFKDYRIRSGKTLRRFCADNGLDAGNISKLERGKLPAPESEDLLRHYAEVLGLQEGSEDWQSFMDTAAAERGRVPNDLLRDEELVGKLPVLFRTLRKVTDDGAKSDFLKLAEDVRRL